jgi:hypothetical protein
MSVFSRSSIHNIEWGRRKLNDPKVDARSLSYRVNRRGRKVLWRMIEDGAKFVANGLYTKLLDAIRAHRVDFE